MYPKAGYRFKGDVFLHRVIAFYLRPFNHRYMDDYTTTMYPNTDFPDGRRNQRGYDLVRTELHENVHKYDRWKCGWEWSLMYGFPQVFAVPFILTAAVCGGAWGLGGLVALLLLLHAGLFACHAYRGQDGAPGRAAKVCFYILSALGAATAVAGTIIGGGWLALFWTGVPLFLSPWPLKAIWRRNAEIRGYTATLYQYWIRYGEVPSKLIEYCVKQFTTGSYLWMELDGDYIRKELEFQVSRFESNEAYFVSRWAWLRKRGMTYDSAWPFWVIREFMYLENLGHDRNTR